jgi:hypothetical protein
MRRHRCCPRSGHQCVHWFRGCRVIDAGHLITWPEPTSKQVRAHLPTSITMLKGHLDQTRANAHSTKPLPPSILQTAKFPAAAAASATATPTSPNNDLDSHHPAQDTTLLAGQRTHTLFAVIHEATGQIYTDQPGRFLVASTADNSYMLLLYGYDSNYKHAEAMPNGTEKSITTAYTNALQILTKSIKQLKSNQNQSGNRTERQILLSRLLEED